MTSCAAWDEGHIENTGRDTEEEASPQILHALCVLVSYWILTQHSPLDTIGFGHRWAPSTQITMGNESLFFLDAACFSPTAGAYYHESVFLLAAYINQTCAKEKERFVCKASNQPAKPELPAANNLTGAIRSIGLCTSLPLKKRRRRKYRYMARGRSTAPLISLLQNALHIRICA